MINRTLPVFFFLTLVSFLTSGQPFQWIFKTTGLPQLSNSRFAIGDLDNDNDQDIIITGTTNNGTYSSGIYRNNGDTTFTQMGLLFTPAIIEGDIALGDYNLDSYLDFIISGISSAGKKYTWLCKNNKNGTFSYVNTPFDSVAYGTIKWHDFDNDGDPDVFLSGQNNKNIRVANIYINNGTAGFTLQPDKGLPGFSNGSAVLADFNNDLKTDVAISGFNNNNEIITQVYYYTANGTYDLQPFLLPQVYNSNLVADDFNSDGYKDLLLNGIDENLVRYTQIYQNNGGAGFTSISAGFKNIKSGSLATGDYDNDGKSDVLISGFDNNTLTGITTSLYKNINGNTFTINNASLKELQFSKVAFFDFDNDHDLDIIISGNSPSAPVTWLYRNNTSNPNTPPTPPANIVPLIAVDSVRFSFSPGNDAETNVKALTYNLWINSKKDSFNLLSPDADLATGYLKIPAHGQFSGTVTGWIKGIKEGKYFYRIQSVDNGYKGSVFSPLDSFVVCKPISIGRDTAICQKQTITLKVGGGSDVVKWYAIKNGNSPVSTSFTYNYTSLNTDTISVELTNALGCTLRDSVIISTYSLPVSILSDSLKLCKESPFQLSQGTLEDTVRWYSTEGFIIKSNTLSGVALKNDTIRTITTSKYGCIGSDTIVIKVNPLPVFSLGNDTSICKYSNFKITLTNPFVYSWTINGLLLNNQGNELIKNSISTTTSVIVEATDNNQCKFTDTLNVGIYDLPIADAGADVLICAGQLIKIGNSPAASGGQTPYLYSWAFTDSLSSFIANNSISTDSNIFIRSFNKEKFFILEVTDRYGCTDLDTIKVEVNPKPIIDKGSDKTICFGESVRLGGDPTASNSRFPFTYSWAPGNLTEPNPVVSPGTTTSYVLVVQTGNCKPDTATVNVKVSPLPVTKTVPVRDTVIGFNEPLIIKAFGGNTYKWEPTFHLSDPSSPSPIVKTEEDITYYVTVTDSGTGCSAKDTVNILITNRIFVPNMFSPNGDGQNDEFKIYGAGLERLELKIYDRGGILVFQSNNLREILDKGWDGTYEGKLQMPGAYQWVISGRNFQGDNILFNGKNSGTVFLIK